MKEIVPDLFLLSGFPPVAFNVYVVRTGSSWILIDTASRHARRRILRQLPGKLEAIVITHAHRDHAGSMHAIATETGAPVWAGERDADALDGRASEPLPEQHKDHVVNRLLAGWWTDPHPVERRLREGEEVGAGFEVVEFPGHTPGQVGLWRESDRTAVCADVMRSMDMLTGRRQLGEIPEIFTVDVAGARRSIRKLAALEAKTICFGHGPPLTKNAEERISEFAAELPPEQTSVAEVEVVGSR
jgi:glyoxylase-like metal-dependent hydrolase (beta-lactamase superfamily II)